MAGAFNRKINDLNPNTKSATVKAVVLTKTKPNFFDHKKGNQGVMTFTVRDSRTTVCNCKIWGSKEKVSEYNEKFRIGDVIAIVNPMVVGIGHEAFVPKSTLRIMLVVNEGSGSHLVSDDLLNLDESNALLELLHISHKPLSSVLRLADVRQSQVSSMRAAIQQQTVDLLLIVGAIKPVRVMRNAESTKYLEAIVIDQSSTDGMILSIWHDNWIERAVKNWSAMRTVLHLIDVKVVDSVFHKSVILRFGPQTLVYENPLGREAGTLRSFVTNLKSHNFENFSSDSYADNLPRPEDIRTQMTVKQIYSRLEGHLKDDCEEFTAILYAAITNFDIDGFGSVLSRKCKNCQRILAANMNGCESEQCQLALSFNFCGDSFDYVYNINIHLSDHTGTLVEARLRGVVAERLLKMSVTDFRELLARNDERIGQLKWRFLLNYFELKLLIKKATAVRRQAALLVVDAKLVTNIEEIADRIIVF